jgi:DNA-binding HxlR family transcriptional regulator
VTSRLRKWDAYSAQCPTRQVLDRIADKWAVLILGALSPAPLRFNALLRRIDGVSQKVLSQTLKRLERDGLVSRKAFATVPVTVEYAVTPLGKTLTDSLAVIVQWAEENMSLILSAQKNYDTTVKRLAQ